MYLNQAKDILCTPWTIDTGALDHIVYNIFFYNAIDSEVSHFFTLPNGEKVIATHIGFVSLTRKLKLNNVLCVPSFSFNLVSARKLSQDLHCCLIFVPNISFMQDLLTWQTI